MARFETSGAVLDHSTVGTRGPTAVRLHGLTSSRRRDAVLGVDVTRELGDRRVLAYDARGHGRSTGRPVPDGYRWSALASDLADLLDDVAPGEAVVGAGVSMGSGTLMHLAVREPERFRALVLTLPPTAWATRAAKAGTYEAAARVVETHGWHRFLGAAQAAHVRAPAALGPDHTTPEVTERLLPSVYRGAALSDLPAPVDIAALQMPVLIQAWVDDVTHPLSTAEQVHSLIRGSELMVARTPDDTRDWPRRTALWLDDVVG